jgi:hypothetical protein
MPAFTSVVIGAAALGGLAMSYSGAQKQQKAQEAQAASQAAAIAEQKRAEALRRRQMELDVSRRKREMIRTQVASMGTAEAVATNQGAQFGSALPGAYGGISGRTGVNMLGVNQNAELGGQIFDSNMRVSDHYRDAAMAGGEAAQGAGMVSMGGMLLSNSQRIGQVGGYFFPQGASANG